MSRTANDQLDGHYLPSPLFLSLLDRAFAHFAGAPPTVLQVKSDNRALPIREQDAPAWHIKSVGSAAELPDATTSLLGNGPVLLIAPWERAETARGGAGPFVHEQVLTACRPAGPESLLAALVPASTMAARTPAAEKIRIALAAHWQPTLVLYAQEVFSQHDHRLVVCAIFLRMRVDDETSPLRVFQYAGNDDKTAVTEDFDRLLVRDGGRGQFGYVLRDLPDPGESVAFSLHDPVLKARRDSLSGFGGAATIEALFDTPNPGYAGTSGRSFRCSADDPDAIRVISGRDLKRDGTIGLPDEQTHWAKVPHNRQLQTGDILLQAVAPPTIRRGLVVAEVTESDLPATASDLVAILRPKPALCQRQLNLEHFRRPNLDPLLVG